MSTLYVGVRTLYLTPIDYCHMLYADFTILLIQLQYSFIDFVYIITFNRIFLL
jgi:hypothetical protein